MSTTHLALTASLIAAPAFSQAPNDPFPDPIEATKDVIRVGYIEFAILPDVGGERARPMRLVAEPGSERLFVNDMQGPIYTIGYDGELSSESDSTQELSSQEKSSQKNTVASRTAAADAFVLTASGTCFRLG